MGDDQAAVSGGTLAGSLAQVSDALTLRVNW
jgi:hypothetical protein